MITINDRAFAEAGAGPRYRDKMIVAESLHRLKDKAPHIYRPIWEAAHRDPDYMRWAKESYDYSKKNFGEKRSFAKWHKVSRFDQILMSYLFAGDPDLPSMKEWDREKLPIGKELRGRLEELRELMEVD